MFQLSQKESFTDIPLTRAGFLKLLVAGGGLIITGQAFKRLEDKAALRGAALAPGGGDGDLLASLGPGISGQYIRSNGSEPNWGSIPVADLPLHDNAQHDPDMLRRIFVNFTEFLNSEGLNFFESGLITLSDGGIGAEGENTLVIDLAPGGSAIAVNANTGTAGGAKTASRGDHRHQVSTGVGTATPVVSATNVQGTNASLVRFDHQHGLRPAISTKTANYTITLLDFIILGDATSGNITITLPNITSLVTHVVIIKKIDSSVNTVTISADASDNIEGSASVVLSTQYNGRILIADGGSRWYIMASV